MIIEDDYDSEFQYDVAPLPTLAELAPDRTVYLGTVAKTICAGLRLGWLVAPPELIQVIRSRRKAIADFPSVPLQHAMLSLLRDGELDRTVRSARRIYRARDNTVARALSPFGELRGVGAGLHTTLVLDATTAVAVRSDAAAAGIDVSPVAESSRGQSNTAGIVVGYGALTDAELDRALAVLAASLGSRVVS